jgi:hypothetical protein
MRSVGSASGDERIGVRIRKLGAPLRFAKFAALSWTAVMRERRRPDR